jgi:hypothetical protein
MPRKKAGRPRLDKVQFAAAKQINGPHWRPATEENRPTRTRSRVLAGKKRRLARKENGHV